MLARTYKSAVELGISDRTRESLIEVLGMLEHDAIPNKLWNMACPAGDTALDPGPRGQPKPGCIIAWARTVSGDRSISAKESPQLKALCRPGGGGLVANQSQAARALRGYLTTGKTDWNKVLEDA